MKKILITGALGQVGYELKRTLAYLGTVVAIDKEEMDFCSPASIRKVIREISPDIIVNPGAYTAVDLAENESSLCMAINKDAPLVIAEEAKALKALLIHYSTDYVFDGTSPMPYVEGDIPNPLNVYGLSKYEGEKAIREIGGRHLILRTSWVYGIRGKNFLLTMLKLGKEKESLNIVNDQIGAPTWSRSIAQATAQILAKIPFLENREDFYGIYNLTSSGKTSWLAFADEIFSIYAKRNPGFKKPALSGILTKDYKTPAKRPLNSLLAHQKLNSTFGIFMPNWKNALLMCMEDLCHFCSNF
jgi:dTDP-4-dehydrorhamnose reductase